MKNLSTTQFKASHPYGIFLMFFIISFYFGMIGNYVFYLTGMRRGLIDFSLATLLWFISFFIMITVFFFNKIVTLTMRKSNKTLKIINSINQKKFSITADVITVIGIIATFAVFAKIGFIPSLVGSKGYLIDAERFVVMEAGWLNRFVYLLSISLVMKIFEMQFYKKITFKNILFIFITIVSLFLYGSKYLILMPMVVAILNHHFFIKKITFKKIFTFKKIIIFLLVLYSSIIFTNYRGLGRAISNDLISDVFIVFFPESRGMASIVNQTKVSKIGGNPFSSVFYSAVPSEIFKIFGVNKHKLNKDVIKYKEIMGAKFVGGSARIGIIGESYVVFGIPGVITCAFILSIIVLILHNFIVNATKFSFASILCVILLFQFCWLFVSEVSNNMPLTFLFLYAGIAIDFITKKRRF